jgi:hypothetical protein
MTEEFLIPILVFLAWLFVFGMGLLFDVGRRLLQKS